MIFALFGGYHISKMFSSLMGSRLSNIEWNFETFIWLWTIFITYFYWLFRYRGGLSLVEWNGMKFTKCQSMNHVN